MKVKSKIRSKGDIIKLFRTEKNMSRMDVYDVTNVNPESLRRLEQSTPNPGAAILFPIAQWMGVAMEDLLDTGGKDKANMWLRAG